MISLSSLRNWFPRFGESGPQNKKERTVSIFPNSPQKPVMELANNKLLESAPPFHHGSSPPSYSPPPSLPPYHKNSPAYKDLVTAVKEFSLMLWARDFKNPAFPAQQEIMDPETGVRQRTWAMENLIFGWELLQRWILGAEADDNQSRPNLPAPEPMELPIWYIHPSGQLALDQSMMSAHYPVLGHRLVILLSRSPDQAFVEKIGRYLSSTNLQPMLLTGPSILRYIPSHGKYFLPSCTEITFFLDCSDYSLDDHIRLNAMRHRMHDILHIPTSLEFTTPPVTQAPVVTPIVETDRVRHMTNPRFSAKDKYDNVSLQGGGEVRNFPPSGPNFDPPRPSRPGGPHPRIGF